MVDSGTSDPSRQPALQVRPVTSSSLRRLKWDNRSPPCSHFSSGTSPADTMSKSGTLKVKSLFKVKSPGKDGKESKSSGTLKDGAPTVPVKISRSLPTSPGPLSPGDSVTLAGDSVPVSPKKKGLRLSFKMKRKNKRKESDGGDVFFPDVDDASSVYSQRWEKICIYFSYMYIFKNNTLNLVVPAFLHFLGP